MNMVVSYLLTFLFIGFHGFHVFSGVINNIIIFFNVLLELMRKEKVWDGRESGFYWHFVDLVGYRIHSFLSSLIFKSIIMSHGHEHVSNISRIWKVFFTVCNNCRSYLGF
jgi:hypothetical protein